MDRNIRINFDPMRDFVAVNIKALIGICGLYSRCCTIPVGSRTDPSPV